MSTTTDTTYDLNVKVGAAEMAVRLLLGHDHLPDSARITVENLADILGVEVGPTAEQVTA